MVAVGCAHAPGPADRPSLIGSSAPLLQSASVRLAVAGAVDGRPAEIAFDVASSATLVADSCLEDPTIEGAQVKLSEPLSPTDEVYPVTQVASLRVGTVTLLGVEAALMHSQRCVVVLGLNVLGGLALQVKVATRQLSFVPSRSREAWLALGKVPSSTRVLEVSRDPTHDWPLIAVRVHQGPSMMTSTFVLSTRDRFSRVFEQPARGQGLLPGLEVLQGHGLASLPPELEAYTGFPYERLELSPGLGVSSGTLDVMPGAPPHGIAGSLAVDVWGRFDTTYDVKAGVLALHQPAWSESGHRVTCGASEMECYELHSEKGIDGINTVTTIWRPLERGGRLYFDVVSPTAIPCRIGVSFSEGDRGRSAQHTFPWRRLAQLMPACAGALAEATEVKLGLFDEGPLDECPGVCGFVQDLRTRRVSCECQPKSGGTGSEAERKFFELYHQVLGPAVPLPEIEPSDPD